MTRLHNMRSRPGSRHRVKRLGCGESSGHGKTSGKGHKGQKARSGGSLRLGFEGGQMPLIRRLPKRGFNNAAFHKRYAIVNLVDLNEFKAGSRVDENSLRQSKLVRGDFAGIKILGDGELKHPLTIEVDKISTSARDKIEKAGGTVSLRDGRGVKRVRGEGVELAADRHNEAPAKESAKKKTLRLKKASRAKGGEKASGKH
jgi:large subunit ribosomal protein L15